jgi:hypothetical protein
MRPGDVACTVGTVLVGAFAGHALGEVVGLVIGLVVGLATGLGVFLAGVRLLIAVPVVIGALVGGILGRSIARVLCFPSDCVSTEIVAALLAGSGTLVGVGLVAALVTRSFDEFQESAGHDRKL